MIHLTHRVKKGLKYKEIKRTAFRLFLPMEGAEQREYHFNRVQKLRISNINAILNNYTTEIYNGDVLHNKAPLSVLNTTKIWTTAYLNRISFKLREME